MIAIALALAAAGDHPNDALVRDYVICARRTAARLEPSGESPTDIADAAKAYCSSARSAALNSSRDFKGGSAASIDEIDRGAFFFAKAQVIVARLCRKTKDCGLASIP